MESCDDMKSWLNLYRHKVPYAAIMLIFSPITILLNMTLIASFMATRQVTQNTSNILLYALSFTDLVTGAVSMPLTASSLLNMTDDNFCIKGKILIAFSGNGQSSIMLTLLLAVDRYLHMNPNIQNRPSRFAKIFKKPYIYYLIVVLFIISNSISASIAFTFASKMIVAIATAFTGLLVVQIAIITCLYARGFLRIRKFTDSNPVYSESVGSAGPRPDYVRRLYRTVMVILSLTFVQYVPYCTLSIISMIFRNSMQLHSSAIYAYIHDFATLTIYSGSFTNCFAVLYFNNSAKDWIFRKIGIQRTL